MNAMSAAGWQPRVGLWKEENTLMHEIKTVLISTAGSDEKFSMYHTKMLGRSEILQQLELEGYSCSQVSLLFMLSIAKYA